MCSIDSEETVDLVVSLLFSGGPQSGGGVAQDVLDLFKRACSIPCRRAHTQVKDAIDKIKELPAEEYDAIVLDYFKKALGVGAAGLVMFGPQETKLASFVLSALKQLADTISFERIIHNAVGSVMWTGQAVLPSARIIVGVGLARVIIKIIFDIKARAAEKLITLDRLISTTEGNAIVINAIHANTHFVREKLGPAVNAAKRLFGRNANVPRLVNAPANNRGRSRARRGSLGLTFGMRNAMPRSVRSARSTRSRSRRQ